MRFSSSVVFFVCLGIATFEVHAVEFGVFGDVNINSKDTTSDNHHQSFALGGLDLFASQDVSDNSKAFIEMVFEDVGGGYIVDIERLWIKYTFKNAFHISGGRFHTPMGFWNKNFHHGTLIQDTATRPFFLEFEDGDTGILPMHTVGLRLGGREAAGNGLFKYDLLIGNSSSLDTTTDNSGNTITREILVNNVTDPQDNSSYSMALSYEYVPAGFEYGLFAMQNNYTDINAARAGKRIIEQSLYSTDLRFTSKYFTLLSEAFYIENTNDLTETTNYITAWYAQIGLRLSQKIKLVMRQSHLEYDSDDLYIKTLLADIAANGKTDRTVMAVRFDIDESSALKVEFGENKNDSKILAQWSFLLF